MYTHTYIYTYIHTCFIIILLLPYYQIIILLGQPPRSYSILQHGRMIELYHIALTVLIQYNRL